MKLFSFMFVNFPMIDFKLNHTKRRQAVHRDKYWSVTEMGWEWKIK